MPTRPKSAHFLSVIKQCDASHRCILRSDASTGSNIFNSTKLSFSSQPNGGNDPQTILYLPSLVPFTKASAEVLVHHAQEYFPTPLLVMCGPEGLTGTFQVGDVCAGREGRRKTKISTHPPICQMQTHTMSSRYVYFYHRRCSIT